MLMLIPYEALTCYIVTACTFFHCSSFTSGYIFGARLDVTYEQMLHNQEVAVV